LGGQLPVPNAVPGQGRAWSWLGKNYQEWRFDIIFIVLVECLITIWWA
jgi:hypothetical protein